MKLKAGGYSEAIYKGKTKEVIGGQFIIDHVQNG